MRKRRNGCIYECVLIDLNTQEGFLGEQAACGVSNADTLRPVLRSVVAWAKRNEVPIVSSVDSHRACELRHSAAGGQCLDGSAGQRKLGFTLMPNRVSVEGDNTLTLPLDLFEHHQQVCFRKRSADLLANPKADRFLTQLATREYVVFGVGLEDSVKALALGLLARNRRVTVVGEACGYWNASLAEFTLRQVAAKGAELITVEELLARKLPRPRRYSKMNGESAVAHPGRSGVYPAVRVPSGSNGNGLGKTNVGMRCNGKVNGNGRAKPNGRPTRSK